MKKRYNLLVALVFGAFMGYSQTATLPITEDFESEGSNTSCTATIALNSANFSNVSTDGSQDWSPDAGGTTSSSTGPSVDAVPGTSAGKYLYTETSGGCNGNTVNLESVYMNWTAYAGVRIEFQYHMYGATMGTMHVDIRKGSGAWVNDVIPSWTDNLDQWQPQDISIFDPTYVGNDSIQIRIRAITGTSYTSDAAIDDIRINPISGLDLLASAIASPQLPVCSGSNAFALDVTNNGTDTITSFMAYNVVNGAIDSAAYSGSLFPGATTTVNFNNVTIAPSSVNSIVMYTANPNGMADGVPTNDTISLSGLQPGLAGGTFTLDANSPASATNYQSFGAFTSDVNTYGICGPITLDVVAGSGPYNEQVIFGDVVGTNAVDMITINGNGDTLVYGSTTSSERAALVFEGSSFITVNDLVIDADQGSTYGWGVHLSGADNVTLSNCTVITSTTSSSSGNFNGIVASGSKTSATTSGSSSNITVDSCTVIGGYYSVSMPGVSIATISNNALEDFYAYGSYNTQSDSVFVLNNDISRPTRATTTTFYGIYSNASTNSWFNANAIHNPFGGDATPTSTMYPIYMTGDATTGNENLISNNLIYDLEGTGTIYGIYDLGSDGANYVNNTISIDDVSSTSSSVTRGFYQSSASSNSSFVNNIISITRGGNGVKHGIYLNSTGTSITADYNAVYLNSAGTGAQSYGRLGADYATLADWATNTTNGANSFEVDPAYTDIALDDYVPTSGFLNNVALPVAQVTTDYTGAARSMTPDIGAFEFAPPPDDAGVSNIINPQLPICPGTFLVEVEIANLGSANLTSAQVFWNVNGVLDSTSYTGNLAPGSVDTVTLANLTIAAGTIYDVAFYTKNPNGAVDANTANDTLAYAGLRSGLIGAITIDTSIAVSATNYHSFSALSADLGAYGLCGAVSIMPAAGVYNEAFVITNVQGASATNTITIDGGDSSLTVITTSGTADYATVGIDGVSNVTIRNLGIEKSGSASASALVIAGDADDVTIENCEIRGSTSTSSSASSVLFSSSISSSSTGSLADNANIINNRIVGGYYGIRSYGATSLYNRGHNYSNNTIDSVYYYGIYAYYQDSINVEGNTVDAVTRNNVNADGLYLIGCFNMDVTENYVHASDYGLYNSNASNPNAPFVKANSFVNNMVISEADYGMYLYTVEVAEILHNSVVANGTSNPALQISRSTSTLYPPYHSYDVRNNIFVSANTEAVEIQYVDTFFVKFDNNVYQSGGSNTFRVASTNYTDLAAYKAASTSYNTASIEGDPQFVSATNLHVIGVFVNDMGDNSVGVTTDIDGDTRPMPGAAAVDPGADEFNPPLCPPPTNLGASQATLNGADIFWDGTSGNNFEYEVVANGAAQGTGTPVITGMDSVTVVGLTASTTYQFYVREICGRGDFSIWMGPFTFNTANGVPYFQDFENFGVNTGAVATEGWSNVNGTNPKFQTGTSTSSSATGPTVDHTIGAGGIFTYLETSSPSSTGMADTLISAPIYVDPSMSALTLEYWYHAHGATMGSFEVYIDSSGVRTLVDNVNGQQQAGQNDPWILRTANVTGYQGKSINLIFVGIAGSSYTGDLAIDDVRLFQPAAQDGGVSEIISPLSGCGLSATDSVVVEISNNGTSNLSNFSVAYEFNGGTPVVETFAGTIPVGAVDTFTFNATVNLSVAGTYTLVSYTQVTGDGDVTNDTSNVSINSIPILGSFPYSENFESGNGGWVSGGTNSSWALGTPAGSVINTAATGGTNSWITGLSTQYNASEQSFVQGPCFDFTSLAAPQIKMDVWWNSEFSWDGAVLQTSIDGGTTWQNVGAFNDPNNWYNDNSINGNPGGSQEGWSGRTSSSNGSGGWVLAEHDLTGLGGVSGVLIRVAFGSDGTAHDDGFAFDNILIQDAPADDVGFVDFVTPSDGGCTVSSADSVRVLVANYGSAASSNFPVSYVFNGGTPVTETFTGTLLPGDTALFTFNATVNVGTQGSTYTFDGYTALASDANTLNDSLFGYTVTNNATFATYPYFENFDGLTSGATGAFANGWNGTNDGAFEWRSNSGTTSSTATGPTGDHTTGSGIYMYTEASSPAAQGEMAALTSPCIDLATHTSPVLTLSFWYHMYGADIQTLFVEVDSMGTWVTVDAIVGQQQTANGDPFQFRMVNLDNFASLAYLKFRFRTDRGASYDGDVAIDDVAINANSVGIENGDIANDDFKVFPNPSNGEFTLTMPNEVSSVNVEIRDISGKLISEEIITNASSAKQFDLSNLAKGVYFLKAFNDEFSRTEKLIIK